METTINNADDFDLRKTLNSTNWRALRHTGADVNARFLAALGERVPELPDGDTLQQVVLTTVHHGQRAPALRFGEPRVMGLFSALAAVDHVCGGLTNSALREHMAELVDPAYGPRQATYDLRRLRPKGLIERLEGTHTYRVTPTATSWPPSSPDSPPAPSPPPAHSPNRRATPPPTPLTSPSALNTPTLGGVPAAV